MKKPRIVITAAANNFHFIKDLCPAFSEDYDIKMICGPYGEEIRNADLVWMEWADGINLVLLESDLKFKKVILRLHRYEVFGQRVLNDISRLSHEARHKINKLVFVSKKVKEIATMHFPWMCESVVIPNLIDTDKFPFTDRQKGYNILMLGRMSYVKNLPLALTMFHELIKLDSNYKLHVVGEISDPELKHYVYNFLDKTGIHTNTYFYGRMDNDKLPEFMKDMHYICCSSLFESQGIGILEAMCCGLKPVIFDFPGAENIFPDKWRWIDRTGFIQNILSPDYYPIEYNSFVLDRFSIKNKIHLYENLIAEVLELSYRVMDPADRMCCAYPPDGKHCGPAKGKIDIQIAGYIKALKGEL